MYYVVINREMITGDEEKVFSVDQLKYKVFTALFWFILPVTK